MKLSKFANKEELPSTPPDSMNVQASERYHGDAGKTGNFPKIDGKNKK